MGPRFLRDAFCDATKDPKIAGLPHAAELHSFPMEKAMNIKISNTPLLAIAGLTLVFGQAFAGEINVNCDEGDSLQKAIDSGAGSAARREIFVTGFCEENLLISRDRISFRGDGNTVISGRNRGSGLGWPGVPESGQLLGQVTASAPACPESGWSMCMSQATMSTGLLYVTGGAIFLRNGSIAHNNGNIGFLIENGHGESHQYPCIQQRQRWHRR